MGQTSQSSVHNDSVPSVRASQGMSPTVPCPRASEEVAPGSRSSILFVLTNMFLEGCPPFSATMDPVFLSLRPLGSALQYQSLLLILEVHSPTGRRRRYWRQLVVTLALALPAGGPAWPPPWQHPGGGGGRRWAREMRCSRGGFVGSTHADSTSQPGCVSLSRGSRSAGGGGGCTQE